MTHYLYFLRDKRVRLHDPGKNGPLFPSGAEGLPCARGPILDNFHLAGHCFFPHASGRGVHPLWDERVIKRNNVRDSYIHGGHWPARIVHLALYYLGHPISSRGINSREAGCFGGDWKGEVEIFSIHVICIFVVDNGIFCIHESLFVTDPIPFC